MNILFVANDAIPHIGGKSTHILDLKDGFESIGHKAAIVSPTSINRKMNNFIKLILLPIWLVNKEEYKKHYKRACNLAMKRVISNYCKKYKIELISAQDVYAVYNCFSSKKKYDIPVVLTMHTYFGIEPFLDKKASNINELDKQKIISNEIQSLELVDSVVAVDSRIKAHLDEVISKKAYGLHVSSIKNFTNVERFKPVKIDEKLELRSKYGIEKDSFIITCARRLVEKNGVIYAVKAIERIKNKPNIVLLIVGEGPQIDYIKEYIKKNNVANKVIFIGEIQNEKMQEIYQLSDISIVPSITVQGLQEATSVSAIEAMACGLPVIASNIGGLKELIENNVNGFLVNEKDDYEISKLILQLESDTTKRSGLSKNASHYIVENNSNIMAAKKYLKVFMDCMQ